ncbi:MAG: GyrI-like domain-containing protein [Flavitalea sp.]
MQIKTHPAMNVLYSTFQTSLATLHDKVGTIARDLHEEAARQHLLVTGPVYWFYYGADGKPDTIFTLEIAVPISGEPVTNERFLFNRLETFKCIVETHYGAWSELGNTYGILMQKVATDQLKLNGVCREMYVNIDFTRDECNITEVQVGIV